MTGEQVKRESVWERVDALCKPEEGINNDILKIKPLYDFDLWVAKGKVLDFDAEKKTVLTFRKFLTIMRRNYFSREYKKTAQKWV